MIFQFRAEVTNVMNWVNLATRRRKHLRRQHGKITSAAGTQRVIQLGGRLTF